MVGVLHFYQVEVHHVERTMGMENSCNINLLMHDPRITNQGWWS